MKEARLQLLFGKLSNKENYVCTYRIKGTNDYYSSVFNLQLLSDDEDDEVYEKMNAFIELLNDSDVCELCVYNGKTFDIDYDFRNENLEHLRTYASNYLIYSEM